MNLKLLLQELEKILAKMNSPLMKYFNTGASEKEIQHLSTLVDLTIPSEVLDLYRWRDGLDKSKTTGVNLGELYLFNLGKYLSFNRAIDEYHFNINQGYWEKKYFPLFESGGGDFFLIDCDNSSATFRMILYYSPSDPDFEHVISIYDSLESLLTTVCECFKREAYYYNLSVTQSLLVSPEKEVDICKRLNPKSEYWNLIS